MNAAVGVISGVRVTHERASVDEIAAASDDSSRAAVESLLTAEGVREAFALQTCNRAEAYVVTDDPRTGRAALDDFAIDVREDAVVRTGHEESLRHLMRVATGLESLVLGEDQILGQLRTAYEEARGVGAIGSVLEDGVTKAIHVGERARTETSINEGAVSLGSAAATLVVEEIALAETVALVVGAGEMGTLAARALADAGARRVVVANRTVPHAEHVADEVSTDASAVALDALPAAVETADVVVTATGSPDQVVDAETLSAAGETLVVDIAQPRDVAPSAAELADVTLYDLDALEGVTDRTREHRRAAAESVEAMIDREFEHLLVQYKRKRADEVVAAMHEGAERVKTHEVATAVSKLEAAGELSDEQREVVEAMADALVSKLLAAPTRSLRDAAGEDDWETINTALRLFDPEFGADASEFVDAAEGRPDVAAAADDDD